MCSCLYSLSLYSVLTTMHQISVVRRYSTEYVVPVKSSVHVQFGKKFVRFFNLLSIKIPSYLALAQVFHGPVFQQFLNINDFVHLNITEV